MQASVPSALRAFGPLTRRQRRCLLAGGAVAVGALCVYQLARSDTVAHTRRYFARLRAVLLKYADALSTGADTLHAVLLDLQHFLQSDTSEVPPSLRQLARLLQSQEVAASATQAVSAVVQGVAGGLSQHMGKEAGTAGSSSSSTVARQPPQQQGSMLDRLIEAAMSERGRSLVSIAVSLGARNLVSSYLETQHRLQELSSGAPAREPRPDFTDRLLAFLARPEGQQLVALATGAFVSHGMRVYMDESMEVNVYEDIFASMAKPQHLEAVRACVGTFAREAVGAAMAASRQQQQQQELPPPGRLLSLIEELPAGSEGEHEAVLQHQQVHAAVPEWLVSRHDDLDSDSLLHASSAVKGEQPKGSPQPATSADSGFAVATPLGAESPTSKLEHRAVTGHPQKLQVAAAAAQPGRGAGAQNQLGWVSAVTREWLSAVRDPDGRAVMVELAGAAAKEAAHGLSSALAERFDATWFVLFAFLVLACSWLCLQTLQLVVG